MAVSVDYVGNRGRDNTATSTSTRGRSAPTAGSRGSASDLFDPNGELVPLSNTVGTEHQLPPVHQQQTLDSLNTDFDSLELGLDKRYLEPVVRPRELHAGSMPRRRQHRHRQRPAARLRAMRPRQPSCVRDQRERGCVEGSRRRDGVPRATPAIRLTRRRARIPTATNVNNDRPKQGVDDLTQADSVGVDSRGFAIRNGLTGQQKTLLDGRVQYIWRIQRLSGRIVPGDLQPDQSRQLWRPDRARNSTNFMIDRSWRTTRGRHSSASV